MNIENEILAKKLTAPRVTPQHIEEVIVSENYFTAADACGQVTDDMVSRFLAWKLPADFYPDGGIRFTALVPVGDPSWPSGTHLLTGVQARQMLDEVLQSSPTSEPLKLLTFCVLTLRNGFTVTGESACASPENFDAEIGRKIARANAVAKIWPLEGYLLKQALHDNKAKGA